MRFGAMHSHGGLFPEMPQHSHPSLYLPSDRRQRRQISERSQSEHLRVRSAESTEDRAEAA